MKHGDKAKAKAAQTASKASSGKNSKAAGEKSSGSAKAAGSSKAKDVKTGKQAGAGNQKDEAGGKAGGNGKPSARRPAAAPAEAGTFTNPIVANAFKRAIKKYPNAFRRLTD
ncbi:MAG TPA: hypothetical protein VJ276_03500 [Thermoanaerobaculia bacterium]|nr:hypothetical protein [Thermoanaerobaculia bacterium]